MVAVATAAGTGKDATISRHPLPTLTVGLQTRRTVVKKTVPTRAAKRQHNPVPRRQVGQQLHHRLGVHRLHEVRVETCPGGFLPVLVLAPSGHGHHHHDLAPLCFAHAPRRVVAVQLGQADVQQHEVGPEGRRCLHCFETIMRQMDLVAAELQQLSERLCRIPVVVDPRELARNFLCGGRSYLRDATVDSVAHPATGALLQGVRPFLPHRPETRLVAGFFVSHHSIVVVAFLYRAADREVIERLELQVAETEHPAARYLRRSVSRAITPRTATRSN